MGIPEGAALFRHDHSAPLRRAGLFPLCAFGSGAAHLGLFDHGGRHGHGAEFAGAGRIADAVRHARATRLLAAAPGRWPRSTVLWPHQPRSGLGCRVHGGYRRGVPPGGGWSRTHRHPPELAQALHHLGAGGHGAGAGVQDVGPRWHSGRPRRHRYFGGAGAHRGAGRGDRSAPSAGDAGVSERPQPGPRCVRAPGRADRRRGACRPGLADADERAGGRARHFAAVTVGRGRRHVRAHHGHVRPGARAVRHSHRQVRRRAGTTGPPGGQRLSG
ncbi:hypothetical protein D3C86_1056080 [compost metagenome]